MGLDALLAKMERRAADTPDTPCNLGEVSAKPAPVKACTLDTPDTPEKSIAKLETLLDRQLEARRQKVIALLDAAPALPRAIHVDDSSDPHNIILCVAVRHPTRATCEMLIPKAKYDPFALLELLMQHETQNVH